jgi:hypothetical protein
VFRTLLVLALLASCASQIDGRETRVGTSPPVFGVDFTAEVIKCGTATEVDLVNLTDKVQSFEVTVKVSKPLLKYNEKGGSVSESQVVSGMSPGGGQIVDMFLPVWRLSLKSWETPNCSVTARIR